jgi:hypothetical protein
LRRGVKLLKLLLIGHAHLDDLSAHAAYQSVASQPIHDPLVLADGVASASLHAGRCFCS